MNSRELAIDWLADIQQTEGAKFLNTEEPDVMSLARLLETYAAEAKAEQRQMCGEAVLNEYNRREPRATGQTLVDACLNATGESDD